MPVEGRDLSSRQTQYAGKDLEIGQPINSDECSETAGGVARESGGEKSCPRTGCVNLPVRFDERDVETEPWRSHWAPPDERGGNRYVLPNATAPHLDSTPNGPSLFRRPIFAVERRSPVSASILPDHLGHWVTERLGI